MLSPPPGRVSRLPVTLPDLGQRAIQRRLAPIAHAREERVERRADRVRGGVTNERCANRGTLVKRGQFRVGADYRFERIAVERMDADGDVQVLLNTRTRDGEVSLVHLVGVVDADEDLLGAWQREIREDQREPCAAEE